MDFFAGEIHKWYHQNKRDLPWRITSDPYLIWISEIMLQQTRVNQAIDYYNRFMLNYPTVFHLAQASEDEILKLWQGLGYYSRARNMHKTAQILVNEFQGTFPTDYKKILSLKGVGKYSAAAIASIAFNLPYAAIDGNVSRVISRLFGIYSPINSAKGKKEIEIAAESILPGENAGIHNQAMMEFGALQCVPKSPDCGVCPLMNNCFAAINNHTAVLPIVSKKALPIVRYFYYYIIICQNEVLLEKRKSSDIWKNLFQFPLIELKNEIPDSELLKLKIPGVDSGNLNVTSVSQYRKHQLTHQTIRAKFFYVEAEWMVELPGILRVDLKDIYKFAVPRLLENEIEKLSQIIK